jgi:glycosyltransferase involved in cell wall biosynthesis
VSRRVYLNQTLASIAHQKGEFEVIVVDDSGQGYAQECLPQDLRSRCIVVANEVNRGRKDPTIPWNQGLLKASGDYVILLGDDDFIDSDYLESMRSLIGKHPTHDLYRCRLRIVNGTGSIRDLGWRLPELETWDEFLYMRNRYLRPHSTVEYCARKARLVEIGGYASLPLALGSDDLTWLLMSLEQPIASTNATFGNWRISSASISGTKSHHPLRQTAHLQLFEQEKRIIEECKPKVVPRELLVESLHYRFQGFINNSGFKGKLRPLVSCLVPSAIEKIMISVYKRARNQDLKPHFLPSHE